MKTYTGIIEYMGNLVDISGRGGKIEYIIIGNQTLRRIACACDVYSFLKIGMAASIYVHSLPLLGIPGVKDMGNKRKFMVAHKEVISSCIMRFVILGILLILPYLLPGTYSVWMIIPLVTPAILYFDYANAKTLA